MQSYPTHNILMSNPASLLSTLFTQSDNSILDKNVCTLSFMKYIVRYQKRDFGMTVLLNV